MEINPVQYIFMVMTAAAGGFMLTAVRDAVFGQGNGDAGDAMFLAVLSGAITLVLAVIFVALIVFP